MATPTTFFGLQKAAEGENYDLDLTNANLDAIDLGLLKITTANSTLDTGATTCTGSSFTRLRVGNQGIVVALIACSFDVPVTLAANTAASTVIGTLVPAGFMPAATLNPQPGVLSGNGQGTGVQWSLTSAGQLQIRSEGASFNTVAASSLNIATVYRWDGNP